MTDKTGVTNFEYDGLGRLTRESKGGIIKISTYDENGNRLSFKVMDGTAERMSEVYTYDNVNRLKTVQSGGDTTTYTYDNNGNTTGRSSYEVYSAVSAEEEISAANAATFAERYIYDGSNRLISAENEDGRFEYTYDATGLRQSKTVNGELMLFVNDGMYVAAELDSDRSFVNLYTRGHGLIKRTTGTQNPVYYMFNSHGDVSARVQNGTVIEEFEFDAFGNRPPEAQGTVLQSNSLISGILTTGQPAAAEPTALPAAPEGAAVQQEPQAILQAAASAPAEPTEEPSGALFSLNSVQEYRLVPEVETGYTTYISDMEWVSSSNGYGTMYRDLANGGGTPERINDYEFAKGVGCHANSEIVININNEYSKFVSYIGLDENCPSSSGSATFKVYGDNVLLYESGVMTGAMDAAAIEVDVSGVTQLRLVTDGGASNNSDGTDWADTQLIRRYVHRTESATVRYLSDMSWISSSNGYGAMFRDLANGGWTPLRINGCRYEKGIGCHADSQIIIGLNGEYRTFESFIGLDDGCPSYAGSASFRVYGDNELLYESGVMTGAMDAQKIRIDVTGVQQLKLVTDGGESNNSDGTDWADAKLIKDIFSTEKMGYNGEYHDAETGFIYLRARYYDPETGRFICEDPIKDGLNWYAYCGNNPVMC